MLILCQGTLQIVIKNYNTLLHGIVEHNNNLIYRVNNPRSEAKLLFPYAIAWSGSGLFKIMIQALKALTKIHHRLATFSASWAVTPGGDHTSAGFGIGISFSFTSPLTT